MTAGADAIARASCSATLRLKVDLCRRGDRSQDTDLPASTALRTAASVSRGPGRQCAVSEFFVHRILLYCLTPFESTLLTKQRDRYIYTEGDPPVKRLQELAALHPILCDPTALPSRLVATLTGNPSAAQGCKLA